MSDPIRHPTLYNTEGSLVIGAATDGQSTYFRIHQDFLAKWAPGLTDLVASLTKNDSYDDAPLLQLQAKPVDVEFMLEFMYSPFDKRPQLLAKNEPDIGFKLYGVLELAMQLKFDRLKQDIISRIKQDWPTTLEKWDDRIAFYAAENEHQPEELRFPEPASVVRASHLESSLLSPLLFYELSNRDHLATLGQGTNPNYIGLGARWDIVTADERDKAQKGRRPLLKWLDAELDTRVVHCVAKDRVPSCQKLLAQRTYEVKVDFNTRLDPLQVLLSALSRRDEGFDDSERVTCEECYRSWVAWVGHIRKGLFENLPIFYGNIRAA